MVNKIISQINQERLKQKLTLKELSRRSGVSEKHICQINTGKTNPTIEVIERIAKALRVDLEIINVKR